MSDHQVITRRDFVRGTVGVVVASSACSRSDTAAAPLPPAGPRQARSARVVIVRDQAALNDAHEVNQRVLDQMVADTVVRVTGAKDATAAWQSLFKPTDVVGLVPTPHLNPTHRELFEAVRWALIRSGLPSENVRDAQGTPERVAACTALISMPGLKAHWLTGIGTVLKNYIMYSGRPRNYHDANSVNLGEIWLLPDVKGKTRLILVDALRPLCDKGPQPDPRFMWDYKGLIAGTDPVAVETVGLQIIMAKRKALRGEDWPLSPPPLSVAAADEKFGLGTSRMSEIRVERSGWADEALI